ncbi:hypothetical protein, partial [Streptomyces sp. SP18CS02]|uniref:hypothetical protein n=1 Tax=Streptomyces sp. SP18CS02 TaxID=3002531 RepID=UPI002E772A9F
MRHVVHLMGTVVSCDMRLAAESASMRALCAVPAAWLSLGSAWEAILRLRGTGHGGPGLLQRQEQH